ncbi:uncharacterized protein LOC128961238 [Oppia nitens]|uniref:uncharacterized protein LOC128961238 n=1 Tax=Oppia nitens TaxID=1686743 RepID=UPI0023D989E6|nr:uncharacterized protein LOC128961238 [Oppia nitens]
MNLTNGSLFVASGHQYWILKSHERPVHDNAIKISNLLTDVSTVDAVINLKIKADKRNKKCHQIREQLIFFTQDIENNSITVNTYEDEKWTVSHSLEDVDVLSAAKSINWSQPIDAFGYLNDIVVIFQGNSYTSLKCQEGVWEEVRHLSLPVSFSGIEGPLDSANFIKTASIIEDAVLYMFKGKDFYICSVYGNEPCNGPLLIVDDFFKFDDECGLSPQHSTADILVWVIIVLFVAIIAIILLAFCCYMFVLRSRQITFWVNRRRTKDRNAGLTYEALNGQQQDPNQKGAETKTTNGNGVEINLEEQTFIDSNGKDEDIKDIKDKH